MRGATSAKAEVRETTDYRSNANRRMSVIESAEPPERWVDEMVIVFKDGACAGYSRGENDIGQSAN